MTKAILAVLVMVIMAGIVNAGQSSRSKFIEALPVMASEMNKKLPMMIDKETRLDSVGADGATMVFVYTLINRRAEEVTQDFKYFLHNQAVNGYCTAMGEPKAFRDNNITIKIHYRGIDGKFITVVSMNTSNCIPSANSLGAVNTVAFRSSEYQLRFNYPREWKREQPQSSETVVKVVSPDDALSFNVGAAWDRRLRNVHPKTFIKNFSKSKIINAYQNAYVNFRLLEAGETTLSNQPAYYAVHTSIQNLQGRQAPWKIMQVFSNRSGIQYTLTAGGYPQHFDKNLELIMGLFKSFVTDAPLSQ
ncbi:MAG: hypothetical protein KJ687_09680 [Proteobacteria bacterium]|nr:hypothetical protein [Pseudomonadota bacterium]